MGVEKHCETRPVVATPGLDQAGISAIHYTESGPQSSLPRYDTVFLGAYKLNDLLYIKRQTLWLDVKLVILSLWITVRGKWEYRGNKLWNERTK